MGIGLVLSGGGAKGMAHIGIIAALIDYGISIDYISGCSSGSIIAALFASRIYSKRNAKYSKTKFKEDY